MLTLEFSAHIARQLDEIRAAGTFKSERVLTSPQRARIDTARRPDVLNLCANNYLGLASHPEIIAAAKAALDEWGYGMASVRFICGTQALHKQLEQRLSEFLGTDDTILYSSCFDANGGLFETLLGEDDAVISDELNHASIIDGIRLCKAQLYRYRNSDMTDLDAKLRDAGRARHKLIATDGVFSMDGVIADLPGLCELAEKHGALVMVDDSHAAGFMGARGRGSHEHHNVTKRVDLLTGTLGKALGGGSGGYTSGRKEVIDLLRQRSRPYLFSNSLLPPVLGASLKSLEILAGSTELRDRLMDNARWFRENIARAGFDIVAGIHPIVPIMLGDAALASRFADAMLEQGVYVIGFSYPVVPQGKARIRVQLSAAHSRADLEFAVEAFRRVRQSLS
jgi:glycine C-acetyltransferase